MKKNDNAHGEPRKQCAALPFRIDDAGRIEVMLVTSRETRRWVIPKGWPIRKLRPNETAAREAYEEAGLAGPVAAEPYGVYTYEKRLKSRAFVPCSVAVYLMEVRKEQKRWPEREERERRWFDPQTAAELVDEPELADLIAALPDRLAADETPCRKKASGG
jgi:8-oxo-dGTP pyrophosphatase MutT (NUDIX family)